MCGHYFVCDVHLSTKGSTNTMSAGHHQISGSGGSQQTTWWWSCLLPFVCFQTKTIMDVEYYVQNTIKQQLYKCVSFTLTCQGCIRFLRKCYANYLILKTKQMTCGDPKFVVQVTLKDTYRVKGSSNETENRDIQIKSHTQGETNEMVGHTFISRGHNCCLLKRWCAIV